MNGIPTSSRRRGELGGEISAEKKRSTSHIKLPDAQEIYIDKGKQEDKLSSFVVKDNSNRHQLVGSKQSQISQSEFMRYRQQIGDAKIKRNSSIHSANQESVIHQQDGVQEKILINNQQQYNQQSSQDNMRLIPKQENNIGTQGINKESMEQKLKSDYYYGKELQLCQQTSPVEVNRLSSNLQMVKSATQFNEGIKNDKRISRDDDSQCYPDQNNIIQQHKIKKQMQDNNADKNTKDSQLEDGFEGMTKCKRATSYLIVDNSYSNNINTTSGTTYQGIMSFGVEQQPIFRNNVAKQQNSITGITSLDNHYNTQPNLQQKCLTSRGKEQNQGINEQDIEKRYSSQQGQVNEQRNSLIIHRKQGSQELQQKHHKLTQLMNDRQNDILQNNSKKTSPVNAINIELQDMNLELQNMNKKLSEQINYLENKTTVLELQLKQSESHKASAIDHYTSLQRQIEQLQDALSEIKVQTEIDRKSGETHQRGYQNQQQQQQMMNNTNRENIMNECNLNHNQQQKRIGKSNYNSSLSINNYHSEQLHSQEQDECKRKQWELIEDYGGNKSDITTSTTGVSQKSSGNIRNIHRNGVSNYSTNNIHMCSYEQRQEGNNTSSFFEHNVSQEKEQQQQQQQNAIQGFDKAIDILSSIHALISNDTSKCSMHNLESLPGLVGKLVQENKQNSKFISSMKELLMKCAPVGYFESEQPSLQLIWKFIKKIMEEYSSLKTQAMQADMVGMERKNMESNEKNEVENEKDNSNNGYCGDCDDKINKKNIVDSEKIKKQSTNNITNPLIQSKSNQSQTITEKSHLINGKVLENQDQINLNDQQIQLIEYSTNISQNKDEHNTTSSLDIQSICACLGVSSSEQIMNRLNDLMSLAEIATAYCGVAQDESKQSIISPQQLYECLAEMEDQKNNIINNPEEEQQRFYQKEQSPCSLVTRVESSQINTHPADQIYEDSIDQLNLNKIH